MSLVFSAGTAAELIKLYPILCKATEAGAAWRFLFTGQAPQSFRMQWDDFELPQDKLLTLMHSESDLGKPREAAAWLARAMSVSTKRIRATLGPGDIDCWLVHGDTMSTLLGALYAKRLGAKLAHVEAGLRSGSWKDPFPEEITRRGVTRLTELHFAPEEKAAEALRREHAPGEVVFTHGNTQIDAIVAALKLPAPAAQEPYALVNLHRMETLLSKERREHTKRILMHAAQKHRLFVVMHETTRAWVDSEGPLRAELEALGVSWLSRQPFRRFAHWLSNAQFVLSDSGGNQEECAFLGVPCLLLRNSTEREIPANRKNIVLSCFDDQKIEAFLADPGSYLEPRADQAFSPAEIIWQHLSA